ncbi:excitatory amino acid transporter 3-like isoform X1 [Micropterus dolomieu]|uniref:excitatory amino acid transporter 3-like isoform X1 n=1 Tax=Micropterus dolomieu TaxID=147949 RepID=UPI001E8E0491|nr:excitatory amino acid transporter 3-like isoform X1 [Micropterus dolomieu]
MEDSQLDSEAVIKYFCICRKKCWNYIVQNVFVFSSVVAGTLGAASGVIAKTNFRLSDFDKLYIRFPGEILTRMLQLVTVPLIVTGVITGVSGLSAGNASRKIVMRAAVYFVLTTLMSGAVGLTLVLLVKPGVAYTVETDDEEEFINSDTLFDLVRNIVPQNLVRCCLQKYKTEKLEFEINIEEPNSSLETNATDVREVGHFIDETNVLGLTVCSFFFGLILKRMGQRGKILVDILIILNENTKYAVDLILCYFPLGLMFMIVSHIVEVQVWETTYKLGKFLAVVVVGLAIHGVIVLPTLYLLLVRRNPWSVIKGVSPALLAALLTSSSSATLPLTFRCCEARNIDHTISRFMLPIGTNANLDGTTIYEVVAAVFVSQLSNVHLDLSELILLVLTAAVSSIGAAQISVTGVVTTFFVLTANTLPAKDASTLVFVHWLLDRCNTVVNVLGDCIGVALVDQLSRKELEEMERQDQDRISTSDSDIQGHIQNDEGHSSSSIQATESLHTTPAM